MLTTTPRTRAIADSPRLAARAVDLLQRFRAFVQLDAQDATAVVAYLREVSHGPGEVMIRAGDTQAVAHLLLALDGEVSVETGTSLPGMGVPIAVLGAGWST